MIPVQDLRRQFVRAALDAPYLSREEEQDLLRAWSQSQDEQALARLTHAHMRLVIALAARFRHYGLPMSDLVQEGHVGLLEAARRFELDRDVRFSTYASWWIRAAIQDFVLRNWSIVRGGTSSAQKALFFNLRRIRARLSRHGSDTHSLDEAHRAIAAQLGVSVADVAAMDARLSSADMSLSASVSDDDPLSQRLDFLIDTQPLPDDNAETSLDTQRRQRWLQAALGTLSDRELHIIKARRLREDQVTLDALGASLGLSKERVRQIENRAMDKMRAALEQLVPKGALTVSPGLLGYELNEFAALWVLL